MKLSTGEIEKARKYVEEHEQHQHHHHHEHEDVRHHHSHKKKKSLSLPQIDFKGFIEGVKKDFEDLGKKLKRLYRHSHLPKISEYVKILIVCFAALVICVFISYRSSEEYLLDGNHKLNANEITEDDFPYHYMSSEDYEEGGVDIENINFDDIEENEYLINNSGNYELSGEFKGTLTISSIDENVVHLILNNVDIESDNGPALVIENAQKVIITLKENSFNTISDSGNYKGEAKKEGCIDSNSSITINGSGSLEVTGLYKDGIKTNDTFRMVSGYLFVHSKRSAIHATDGIHINGGEIVVASEKYGFKTTKNSSGYRGSLIIMGGKITVIAGRYAFVSDAPIFIENSDIIENATARFSSLNGGYIEETDFE